MRHLLITRHAPYGYDNNQERESLTDEGLRVCAEKVATLRNRQLGAGAVLLSSSAPRAVLTAHELRRSLGLSTVYKSRWILAAGTRPDPVQSLHEFTDRVLAGVGVTVKNDADVLLITHKPLVDAVDRNAGDRVVDVPDDWRNPRHQDFMAAMAENPDGLEQWLR